MKKLLLFFSATLFALGTAFAQAVLPTADLFAVQGPETLPKVLMCSGVIL